MVERMDEGGGISEVKTVTGAQSKKKGTLEFSDYLIADNERGGSRPITGLAENLL